MIDPQRVEQVIRNLIDNALKFSPQDSQVFLEAANDDGTLRVSVTDRGIGISEAELPFIFERFHQAEGMRLYRLSWRAWELPTLFTPRIDGTGVPVVLDIGDGKAKIPPLAK